MALRSETLYEDEKFSSRSLAAVVASKVFYHLEELDDALKYALGAGELFDVSAKNEYVETLVAKCIDEYIAQRQAEDAAVHQQRTKAAAILLPSQEEKESAPPAASPPPPSSAAIDPRLVAVVERMFTRCYEDGQYHQALGIGIESKRLDQVKAAIRQSPDTKAMLSYAYHLSQTLVLSHSFRRSLLLTLVELYEEQGTPDYLNVCQCFAEADTRILTDGGLLFVDEIEARLHAGQSVLFGTYDVNDKALVYSTGRLVFPHEPSKSVPSPPPHPKELVTFNSVDEGRRWAAGSADVESEDDSDGGPHLSLRVTADHRMFVQLGHMDGKANKGGKESVKWEGYTHYQRKAQSQVARSYESPPTVRSASTLWEASQCGCPARRSGQPDCVHRRLTLRMVGCAESGHLTVDSASESAVAAVQTRLGLGHSQFLAFLELLGCWLSDGALAYRRDGANAITFPRQTNLIWLTQQLTAVGFVRGVHWTVSDDSLHIVDRLWFAWFDEQFDRQSSSDEANEEVVKRLPSWVLFHLHPTELTLVIRGLQRADDSECQRQILRTSDVLFRDQLMQALMHCGFSPFAARLSEGMWQVTWTEPSNDGASDISHPSLISREGVSTVAYDQQRDGRIWCVNVDSPDHLIFAQRAQREGGVVIKQSRPVVVGQCLLFLDDSAKVSTILHDLISKEEDVHSALLAYQIAFDLGENQNQTFLNRVAKLLPLPDQPAAASAEASTATPPASTSSTTPSTTAADNTSPVTDSTATSSSAMDTSSPAPTTTSSSSSSSSSASTTTALADADLSSSDSYNSRVIRLRSILSGRTGTDLYLHFLYDHNATDLNLLKAIKDKLEPRNSVTHNATVMAHSLMHVGTTVDSFLRDNLDWLGKAQNWAKFTATASIGVIHKGHINESLKLLEPYLPSGGQSGSPYQEGGALYALGLVHSSHGSDQVDYLTEALRNAGNNEIVQHGACLGLGLCAMASGNEGLFEVLKNVVMSESAVAGEAAGYAMGLVLLGSGNGVAVEEMIAYAHDTQHEKIIRGLAMGIAMIVYGKEEEADVIIEQLLTDKDPILRYGAMYAIGLAYACTANNAAIQRLLHIAVSDVSDDVRRAAVTCLGFVLANVPEQVPRVVSLLAASYNPHVRYGSALAVGIACAGGATEKIRKEALTVLEPLLKDRVDFVRQGAFIGLSMLLIQHNEKSEPKLALLRKSISDAMNIKSDTMTKLGAILAAGIVDAGGRNVTISLLSSSGHKKMAAIVGLALFPQFWYWYPLIHFLSLAFTPTAVIGLNKHLDIPQGFTFLSKAPASQFAYPPPVDVEKKEVKKEIKHATLSVTAKAKTKAKRKEDEKKGEEEKMEVEEGGEEAVKAVTAPATEEKKEGSTVMDTSTDGAEEKKEEDSTADTAGAAATGGAGGAEEKKELPFHVLSNPARVTLPQLSTLTWPKAQRYTPVKQQLSGFVLLEDTQPSKEEVLVKGKTPKIGIPGVSDDEPEPPKPFEYTGN